MSARKCPPHFFTKFQYDMKSTFSFLAAIALLASCTRPIPPQATPKPKSEYAENLKFMPGYVQGEFENGVTASIYFNGGACIIVPGQSQIEIVGEFLLYDHYFLCNNTRTGDYVLIYKTGYGRANVEGVEFNLFPRKYGTVFVKKDLKE